MVWSGSLKPDGNKVLTSDQTIPFCNLTVSLFFSAVLYLIFQYYASGYVVVIIIIIMMCKITDQRISCISVMS